MFDDPEERIWIAYDNDKTYLVDVRMGEEPTDKVPNATYVELSRDLHPNAIKIEKDSLGNVNIVQDDDKWNTIFGEQMMNIRAQRNQLLQNCDFTQLEDFKANAPIETTNAWIEYRQKLRDITKNISNPHRVVFPSPPSTN